MGETSLRNNRAAREASSRDNLAGEAVLMADWIFPWRDNVDDLHWRHGVRRDSERPAWKSVRGSCRPKRRKPPSRLRVARLSTAAEMLALGKVAALISRARLARPSAVLMSAAITGG